MTATLHESVPFADYLKWPELSQSVLKQGRASMAHLRAAWTREKERKPTDAMILGTALHTCMLEPEQAANRIARWTGRTRAGSVWKEFEAEAHAEGKIVLTDKMNEKLVGAVASLRKHKVVKEWMSKIEAVEVSARGEIDGVPFKGRVDAKTTDPLFDLKFVQSCDLRTFTNAVITFGWYMQGAIYKRLLGRDRFILMAVEKEPPYDCIPYELAPSMLKYGEREALWLIDQVKKCRETDSWPGRSEEIVPIELPLWMEDKMKSPVTIGGAAAFEDEAGDEDAKFIF